MLSGTMWSRNIFHKLTGDPSAALRVTECNRDCILIHLRMRLGCLRTFIFSNAPSCFDSALHDGASKPPLPPCAKIKTVARFSNNSPGKQAKKSPPGTHPRTCLYAAHCERLRSLLRSRSEPAPCKRAPHPVQRRRRTRRSVSFFHN